MSFIVIRHGKSQWNKENKFTGWKDIPLSMEGIQEAYVAGELLSSYNITHLFTSMLTRTIDTGRLIQSKNNNKDNSEIKNNYYDNALIERDYGDLSGCNKDELREKYGAEQVQKWRRGFYDKPPNGESLEDVTKRVGHYFNNNIKPLLKDKKDILVVSHGNTIRALFVHLGFFNPNSIEHFEVATGVPYFVNVEKKEFYPINTYELQGYQILDSRGYPTIEVKCFNKTTKKCIGRGSSPSGASCGSTEAVELRDGKSDLYKGKSVFDAIKNANNTNKHLILNNNANITLTEIDKQLIKLDTNEMKNTIGGNTTTAISFCMLDTLANIANKEIYEYLGDAYNTTINIDSLPTPLVNIINGGKHSVTGELKIQEFMILPKTDMSAHEKNQLLCEVYYSLQKLLVEKYGVSAKAIGDEGGFCPPIYTSEEALSVIEEAITKAGYKVAEEVFIALDCAASEFYDTETKLYEVEKGLLLTGNELIDYYGKLIDKHPALKSIEDGFHESDYESWKQFTKLYSDKIMIVGDDLFTTNKRLVNQGLSEDWANTLLLKVNQIGTVTEAIESAKLMFEKGNNVIVSHRSGETNHAYIIDLAIGIGAKYVKIGSPCRGERVSKFNRLIEIEELLKYYSQK